MPVAPLPEHPKAKQARIIGGYTSGSNMSEESKASGGDYYFVGYRQNGEVFVRGREQSIDRMRARTVQLGMTPAVHRIEIQGPDVKTNMYRVDGNMEAATW